MKEIKDQKVALQQSRKLICKSRERSFHVMIPWTGSWVCEIIRLIRRVGWTHTAYVVVVVIIIIIIIILLMKYCVFDNMVLHGSSYCQNRMMEQCAGKQFKELVQHEWLLSWCCLMISLRVNSSRHLHFVCWKYICTLHWYSEVDDVNWHSYAYYFAPVCPKDSYKKAGFFCRCSCH